MTFAAILPVSGGSNGRLVVLLRLAQELGIGMPDDHRFDLLTGHDLLDLGFPRDRLQNEACGQVPRDRSELGSFGAPSAEPTSTYDG